MIDLSRRAFVGRAAATVAALALPLDLRRIGARPLGGTIEPLACAIVDLGDHAVLRESITGFESALKEASIPFARSHPARETPLVIVPGALRIPSRAARLLSDSLENGATVILESGAVFATLQSREFLDHREMLRAVFAIEIDAPMSLWPADGIPYIDYTWPVRVKVRDFSRVVPVRHHGGEVIARAGGVPVAVHQCQGRGTLIFLGSPLGPALWSGDREARRWLIEGLGARG